MLVRGAFVITDPTQGNNGICRDSAVAVADNGRVAEIDNFDTLKRRYPDAAVEGDATYLVMPGLIDAHCHGNGISHFELGLGYNHLEYWNMSLPSLPKADPYLNNLWCGIKHIRSGCTTIHHMNLMGTWEAVQIPIRAYQDLGIRWAYSLTVKNRNLVTYDDDAFFETLPAGLKESVKDYFSVDEAAVQDRFFDLLERLRSEYHTPEHPLMLGPMGPQWCSAELLTEMKRYADRLGLRIHMHGIQTPYQKESIYRKHGISGVEYLKTFGLLDTNLTLGHGVWVSASDMDLLAAAGCTLTHHASCNLNMRNGLLPVAELLSRGIVVSISIDGKGINDDEDMIQEMRLVEKLHRIAALTPGDPPTVTPAQIIAMGTVNGANVLGLDRICGTLEPGKAADIILVDFTPRPWVHPDLTAYDRFVMQSKAADVKTVIVDGRVVMREGRLLTVDEADVARRLAESMHEIQDPDEKAKAELLLSLRPHVRKFYQGWKGSEDAQPFYRINSRI